ncbi:unnamed protein product, partial [Staurois parvus]
KVKKIKSDPGNRCKLLFDKWCLFFWNYLLLSVSVQRRTDHLSTRALLKGPGSVGGPMKCPWYPFIGFLIRLFWVWSRTQGPHDPLLPGCPMSCQCTPGVYLLSPSGDLSVPLGRKMNITEHFHDFISEVGGGLC